MSLLTAIESACLAGAAYFNYKLKNTPSHEEQLQRECEDIEDEIHVLEARGADADMRRAAVLRLRLNRRRGVLADISNANPPAVQGDGSADAGRDLPDAD